MAEPIPAIEGLWACLYLTVSKTTHFDTKPREGLIAWLGTERPPPCLFWQGATSYQFEHWCRPAGFTFKGLIDQVRIYNRTLSATEIASFTDPECRNRQRTIECIQSPELCESPSDETELRFHCNYGEYDDPQRQGTGVCCP